MLSPNVCQKARRARDPRFDGKFFTAVKTTKIYCRSICPVRTPKEDNVTYFATAVEAANAGYRPCLRCRPDSAPGSPAWKGVSTTFERAVRLIHEGALQNASLVSLAERLGITDRYLRQLFKEHLGVSPKTYALYQQCMFAKQLLHQTDLSVSQIALASGFNSIRRFNDCFQKQLKLTPSAIRKTSKTQAGLLQLPLYYRPPYDWAAMQQFLSARVIDNLEWCDENEYGRSFTWSGSKGHFTAQHIEDEHCFNVYIELDQLAQLHSVVNNIRRVLDLDVDIATVHQDLKQHFSKLVPLKTGLRIPGTWDMFEAGVRAILGQQVSVKAACNLVTSLVENLGEDLQQKKLFPSPLALHESDFDFLKMPGSRKQTLKQFAYHFLTHNHPQDAEQWLSIKGIGQWTVDYAKMRGASDPDIYLGGDLGVKKSVGQLADHFDAQLASPWRSYLTFQLWRQL